MTEKDHTQATAKSPPKLETDSPALGVLCGRAWLAYPVTTVFPANGPGCRLRGCDAVKNATFVCFLKARLQGLPHFRAQRFLQL